MYFAASLLVAFVITLLSVSKIAKMLNAKRPEISWVLFALILGGALAAITAIALGIFVQDQEPKVMLAMTLVATLIVSSAAYKYINKLNWSGAFTLNIASMTIGLLAMVTAIVINGESINDTFKSLNTLTNNTVMAKPATVSDDTVDIASEDVNNETLEENETPAITELDLLPPSAAKDIKKKERKVYIEPKFRVISIGQISSAVGRKIRIHRKNGNTIVGGLKRIKGNDAVVSRYTSKGTVVMPISIAKIHKLEVYK